MRLQSQSDLGMYGIRHSTEVLFLGAQGQVRFGRPCPLEKYGTRKYKKYDAECNLIVSVDSFLISATDGLFHTHAVAKPCTKHMGTTTRFATKDAFLVHTVRTPNLPTPRHLFGKNEARLRGFHARRMQNLSVVVLLGCGILDPRPQNGRQRSLSRLRVQGRLPGNGCRTPRPP